MPPFSHSPDDFDLILSRVMEEEKDENAFVDANDDYANLIKFDSENKFSLFSTYMEDEISTSNDSNDDENFEDPESDSNEYILHLNSSNHSNISEKQTNSDIKDSKDSKDSMDKVENLDSIDKIDKIDKDDRVEETIQYGEDDRVEETIQYGEDQNNILGEKFESEPDILPQTNSNEEKISEEPQLLNPSLDSIAKKEDILLSNSYLKDMPLNSSTSTKSSNQIRHTKSIKHTKSTKPSLSNISSNHTYSRDSTDTDNVSTDSISTDSIENTTSIQSISRKKKRSKSNIDPLNNTEKRKTLTEINRSEENTFENTEINENIEAKTVNEILSSKIPEGEESLNSKTIDQPVSTNLESFESSPPSIQPAIPSRMLDPSDNYNEHIDFKANTDQPNKISKKIEDIIPQKFKNVYPSIPKDLNDSDNIKSQSNLKNIDNLDNIEKIENIKNVDIVVNNESLTNNEILDKGEINIISPYTKQLLEVVNKKLILNEQTISEIRSNFEKLNSPFYIISVSGEARIGKSTFHNLLLSMKKENGFFAAGEQTNTLTRGIWVYTIPVKFKNGYALLVDCEGMDLSDQESTSLMYLFAMLFSTTFTVHDNRTLHGKTLDQLALSIQLLKEIPNASILLPTIVFVLRNTDKLKRNNSITEKTDEVLESILQENSKSISSIIRQFIKKRYLVYLPSPPNSINNESSELFLNSISGSNFLKSFQDKIYPELEQISYPKYLPQSTIEMNINEIIDELYQFRDILNNNHFDTIPSILEMHTNRLLERKILEYELELEKFSLDKFNEPGITSNQLSASIRLKRQYLVDLFTEFSMAFDQDSIIRKNREDLLKKLERIASTIVEKKQKIELKEKDKIERERKIELFIEKEKEEKNRKAEQKKQMEEEKKRMRELQLKEDQNYDKNYQESTNNIKWERKKEFLIDRTTRYIEIPNYDEGKYQLKINLSSGSIKYKFLINGIEIVPIDASRHEVIYNFHIQKNDKLLVELKLVNRSWHLFKKFEYSITLERIQAL